MDKLRCSIEGCLYKRYLRTLCRHHYEGLRASGELNRRFPLKYPTATDCDIDINVKSPEGICYLKVNGISCASKAVKRDLCDRHYLFLSRNNLLDIYVMPSTYGKTLTIKKGPNPDICKAIIGGVECSKKSVRGKGNFCDTHYMTNYRLQKKLKSKKK